MARFRECAPAVLLLAIAALGCCPTVQSNPIWIDEVIVTGEIDDQGMPVGESSVFSPDQPVIYCFVAGRGSDNISVRLTWYYEDSLMFDYRVPLGPDGHNYGYIQLRPGQRWQPGEYRVDVALVESPIESVEFSVAEGNQ